MKNWILVTVALSAAAMITGTRPAQAQEVPQRLVEAVRSWLTDPTVVTTVRNWNETHAGMHQTEIDALDREWRRQTTAARQPAIAQISGAPLSNFLVQKQANAGGQIIEVFVMDAKGLNVGISSVTSDYWQGDEAKFQETFGKGADAIHFGDVEVKNGTGHRAQQVSMTVADPKTGEPIGAITAEVNLDIAALYGDPR